MGVGPHVVYVTGWGRSGSTVLNRLLSGPDVVGVGELRWLWRRGVLDRESCGCGKPWDTCPLWGPAVRLLAREQGRDEERLALELDTIGRRSASMLRQWAGGSRMAQDRARYVTALRRLYETIGQVSGARVILDTSKHGGYAILARATGLNVTIVHLVRDPRAVVWSHRRHREAPAGVFAQPMRPHAAPYVAIRWMARNVFAEVAVRPDVRLRYEDIVAKPDEALAGLWRAIGLPPHSGQSPTHVIAGNINRFDSTPLRLRSDDEWSRMQPRGQRLVTTALSLPVLRRYGYTVHG
jgi:sulfotransferase family protein